MPGLCGLFIPAFIFLFFLRILNAPFHKLHPVRAVVWSVAFPVQTPAFSNRDRLHGGAALIRNNQNPLAPNYNITTENPIKFSLQALIISPFLWFNLSCPNEQIT